VRSYSQLLLASLVCTCSCCRMPRVNGRLTALSDAAFRRCPGFLAGSGKRMGHGTSIGLCGINGVLVRHVSSNPCGT